MRIPAIQEACVIGARDRLPRRDGEGGDRAETPSRKALSYPRKSSNGRAGSMAAFKVPRIVEFVEELPQTATGKILWRELQEEENRKAQ